MSYRYDPDLRAAQRHVIDVAAAAGLYVAWGAAEGAGKRSLWTVYGGLGEEPIASMRGDSRVLAWIAGWVACRGRYEPSSTVTSWVVG